MNKVLAFVMLCMLVGCSHRVDDIKLHAEDVINQAGFKIVGYEGYQYGLFQVFGGCVWYTMEKVPHNGITYHGCISKWGSEYHIYSLSAIDAIKP
jgi:hypothetical protein